MNDQRQMNEHAWKGFVGFGIMIALIMIGMRILVFGFGW